MDRFLNITDYTFLHRTSPTFLATTLCESSGYAYGSVKPLITCNSQATSWLNSDSYPLKRRDVPHSGTSLVVFLVLSTLHKIIDTA